MHRLVLLAGLCLPFLGATALAAEWTSGEHGGREYKLYVPSSAAGKPAPLVVMLHGCTQSAETFAESTRMNELAEKDRFLVLYPTQKLSANPARCWNWFQPANQARSGEPAEIVALVEEVGARYPVDRRRVYVAGLSAGASMAAILAACYPEVFAATAVHDGTMYKSATSFLGAQAVMKTAKAPDAERLADDAWACGGERRLARPMVVFHGQGDNVVNRENGDELVRQFVALNDLADDGKKNASLKEAPAAPQDAGSTYRYTLTTYSSGGKPLVQYYKVDKLGHAWSGGKDDLLFSDAKGPDASALIWSFFRQFNR